MREKLELQENAGTPGIELESSGKHGDVIEYTGTGGGKQEVLGITWIRWEVAGTARNARDRAGIVGMTQERVRKAGNFGKSGKCRKLWEHEETSWNVLEQTGTKGNSAENPGYRRNVREQAGVYWKLGDKRERS